MQKHFPVTSFIAMNEIQIQEFAVKDEHQTGKIRPITTERVLPRMLQWYGQNVMNTPIPHSGLWLNTGYSISKIMYEP